MKDTKKECREKGKRTGSEAGEWKTDRAWGAISVAWPQVALSDPSFLHPSSVSGLGRVISPLWAPSPPLSKVAVPWTGLMDRPLCWLKNFGRKENSFLHKIQGITLMSDRPLPECGCHLRYSPPQLSTMPPVPHSFLLLLNAGPAEP